jgi:hypothetical protein
MKEKTQKELNKMNLSELKRITPVLESEFYGIQEQKKIEINKIINLQDCIKKELGL